MGLFWGGREPKLDAAIEQVIDGLVTRVETLQARVDELEHIEVEWADWFEKYKNLYARLNKRVARDEEKEPPEEPISPAAQRIFNARGV